MNHLIKLPICVQWDLAYLHSTFLGSWRTQHHAQEMTLHFFKFYMYRSSEVLGSFLAESQTRYKVVHVWEGRVLF